MFQTHAMTAFGVRKKKMFLSPRRSSLVRLFLRGGYDSLMINATVHFVPQYTSINSKYYINNILKKELKPVYARLDTSGTSRNVVSSLTTPLAFCSRMVREHIGLHLLFREHG